ncbi:MAG: transcription antitermination protein NusB [Bacteroidales bacterium]|nr:transcription antitermination protein NusB [Bacteroidales bacterium]
MLNRRLIRIKVFKALFAFENSGSDSAATAADMLARSCEKTLELYCFLLNISGSLVALAQEKIDAGLHKFHPSEEEAHPNYRFVNNRFAKLIDDDPEFGRFCQKHKLSWNEYDVFVKKLFASITASDYYKEYMAAEEDSFEADCQLFARIYEEEFEDNELLDSIFEDISLKRPWKEGLDDWSDELAFVLNVIISDLPAIARKKALIQQKVFKNEDDSLFAQTLLQESIAGYAEYSALISENLSNWDPDRLVSTDIALIVMGLAEAVSFPTIPVKVTINEYVEIAKYYSTPNSRIFVNGMLDKLIRAKVESGEIVKVDRGLRES